MVTGLVFGIEDYPNLKDHTVYLIGLYTAMYGLGMLFFGKLDGKFRYNYQIITGLFI